MSALLLLPPAVLATATLSGMLGMGGGMLLMATLVLLLPVGQAMVLHGITQLSSNASRAYLLRRHIYFAGLGWYLVGAALATALFTALAIRVDRAVLLFWLGLSPLLVFAIPRTRAPRFESRRGALGCGFLVVSAQLVAGVSGPLLDIFFVRSELDRFSVVGTKAITQSIGHTIKTIYFAALVTSGADLPIWVYASAVGCAVVGTRIGRRILDALCEVRFRRYTTIALIAIGLLCSVRGAVELLG